jgi:hypothetical protein
MNVIRDSAAAIAAFVVYFALGAAFFTNPVMRAEFMKYRSVYRSQEWMKPVMPFGMLGMLLWMSALGALFAMIHPSGAGVAAGIQFGAIVAVYALGSFVLHNHVNLNIGAKLTTLQAIPYTVEWIAVGIVISLVYRGSSMPSGHPDVRRTRRMKS